MRRTCRIGGEGKSRGAEEGDPRKILTLELARIHCWASDSDDGLIVVGIKDGEVFLLLSACIPAVLAHSLHRHHLLPVLKCDLAVARHVGEDRDRRLNRVEERDGLRLLLFLLLAKETHGVVVLLEVCGGLERCRDVLEVIAVFWVSCARPRCCYR